MGETVLFNGVFSVSFFMGISPLNERGHNLKAAMNLALSFFPGELLWKPVILQALDSYSELQFSPTEEDHRFL
jgi:hypothetical protein